MTPTGGAGAPDGETRWQRLERLFETALALPREEQGAFVDASCADDAGLRIELSAMLIAGRSDLSIERLVAGDPEPAPPDPWLGRRLGPWRIVRPLGRGGMGVVYAAERADGQYALDAAVKLMRVGARDEIAVARFRTERQVLAALKHPHIAGLLDGGHAPDGTPFLVMELVDGVPITDWCRDRRLPLDERLRLFRVACDAVQHAHQALVVHRDLKPSNVFVSRRGDVKLLDFGIAKLLEPAAWGLDAEETATELRVLTPDYAAPEQRGGGAVTTATDVYALGVVLHELIAGERPRRADEGGSRPQAVAPPSSVLRQAARAEAGAPAAERRRLARRVRGDLDRIVQTALRDEPARRYVSAGQLGEEIGRFLEGRPVLAQPDRLGYRVARFVGRNRLPVAIGSALLTSLAAFGLVSAHQARVLAEERRAAQVERDTAEQVVRVLVDLFEATNPSVRPDGDRMPVGEFLEGAQARSLSHLQGAPAVQARLQHVFGMIHHTRGQYGPSRAALEGALAQQRTLHGPDHPAALEALQALGEVVHLSGDDVRGRTLLEESLERHRRVFGEEDARTARALWALAPAVGSDDPERAGDLLRRALAVRRARLGPRDPAIAESLASLGGYHMQRAETEAAERYYREALDVFPGPADRRNPVAISILGDFALLRSGLRGFAEAEQLQREAIGLARDVLGDQTMTVANLLNNLAASQANLGRHRDAEESFRSSYATHLALLGAAHAKTRNVARNVGRALELQGRPSEALPWMDRALGAGGGLPPAAAAGALRAQRAQVLFRLGRRSEALSEAAAAVAGLEGERSAETPARLALARLLLGRMLCEAARPRQAEPLLAAALDWYARPGGDPLRLAEASCELARARLLLGEHPEERRRLEQWLPTYRAWGLAERETVKALDARLQRPPAY